MPTYIVTDPKTGRRVRLTGDTPPTDDDLDEIFSSLPAVAEKPEDRQSLRYLMEQQALPGRLRDETIQKRESDLAALRQRNPYLADDIANMGGVEKALVGVGSGMMSLARGVGLADPADETEKMAIDALMGQSDAAKAGKIIGQAAPFMVPGAAIGNIASTPLRIAASGGLGAAEGGIIASGEGGDAADVALGSGLGLLMGAGAEAALPLINRFGRDYVKRVTGKTVDSAVTSAGPTKALSEALEQTGDSFDDIAREAMSSQGDDVAANAARERAFTDLGLKPTEAQRTRNTDLFVEQQDAFRRGGPVKSALEAQEELLDRRTRGEIAAMGGRPEAASITPIEAINTKALQLDEQIGALYKQAREAAPDAKNIRFSRAARTLRENSPIDTRTDGTVSALRDEMKRLGFLDPEGKPTRLTSVEASENLRQFANTLYDGANPLAKGVIRDFKNSLDDDVFSVAGDDIFKQARSAKSSFEKGLSTEARNKFDKRKVSLVRDVLDNTVTEDKLVQQVINRSSKYGYKDVAELKDYLLSGTPGQIAQGQQAWNDIRAAALNEIRESAFKGPITQTGTQSLSRAGLESGLKRIGPQKFNVLFTPEEQTFIRKLAAVSSLKEPPPGTFTGSGPSSPAIQKLEQTLAKIPVFGDSAKAFSESVRNKASDRRILTLVDDLELIAKKNEREAFRLMRRSGAGEAAGAVPVIGTAAIVNDEEEQ